jgi:hypothetical protein
VAFSFFGFGGKQTKSAVPSEIFTIKSLLLSKNSPEIQQTMKKNKKIIFDFIK